MQRSAIFETDMLSPSNQSLRVARVREELVRAQQSIASAPLEVHNGGSVTTFGPLDPMELRVLSRELSAVVTPGEAWPKHCTVGFTPLIRAEKLEQDFNVHGVYLKWEGSNITGTHKDRIAHAHVINAEKLGFNEIVLATCGNFGEATAFFAKQHGLKCHVYVPEEAEFNRSVIRMKECGANVTLVKGGYDRALQASLRQCKREEGTCYDANPGSEHCDIEIATYAEIAKEIVLQLQGKFPDVVSAPMGNGTTLAGLYQGFLELHAKGEIPHIPQIVGCGPKDGSPIVTAFVRGKKHCEDIESCGPTNPLNHALNGTVSTDGEKAIYAIRRTGGWAREVTNVDFDGYVSQVTNAIRDRYPGHTPLPESCAGIKALQPFGTKEKRQAHKEKTFVVVITGEKD